MTVFRYNALTAEGRKVSGTLESANRREASQTLRGRGMHVTSIKTAGGRGFENLRRVSSSKAELNYLFTSHMRRLLRARLPLLEALDATASELSGSTIGAVIGRVRGKVAGGSSLAESLSEEPGYFDDLYVSMVRAAEASGTLAAAFDTIYQHEGRRRDIRRRLTSALAYPIVLVTVAILAVMFLMSFVVPRITQTLQSARVPLPTVTRVLMAVGGFAQKWWPAAVVVLVLAALLPRILRRFEGGRKFVDDIMIGAPVIRRFARSAAVSRFSRTFASLLATGLRVSDALEVAGKVSGSISFGAAINKARSRIVAGGELAGALSESGLFPGYAVQIVGIGERTGTLAESFEEIARAEEEDLETATERFMTLLEPAIIVVMALVVGFIVASVLLPILSLSSIGAL